MTKHTYMTEGITRQHRSRRHYRQRCKGAVLSAFTLWAHLQNFQATEAHRLGTLAEYGAQIGRRLLFEGSIDNAQSDSKSGGGHMYAELQEWFSHFGKRRLHQTGTISGGIVAISPSGAPLLRKANRNVPTGNDPGSAGEVQLFEVTDQQATSFSQRFYTQVPQGMFPVSQAPVLDEGACHTLAYADGYASFSGAPYQTYRFTSSKADCCELCDEEPECVAWTRIAGGDASTRSCHLLNSTAISNATTAADTLSGPDIAQPPGRASFQAEAGENMTRDAPGNETSSAPAPETEAQLSAASTINTIPPDSTLIVESGTKSGEALPATAYGCPYPPSDDGECTPPMFCNCFDGVCYGSCQGGELTDVLPSTAGRR